MATKKKQRKTEDENRDFKVEWTETFAFIQNLNGLPTCLICKEKLAHNKKSNLERHFTTKHASFSTKYPVGDARKKAVEELQKNQVLYLITGFNHPTMLILQVLWLVKRLLREENHIQTANT
jgi:hypothetical protein